MGKLHQTQGDISLPAAAAPSQTDLFVAFQDATGGRSLGTLIEVPRDSGAPAPLDISPASPPLSPEPLEAVEPLENGDDGEPVENGGNN